MRSERPKVRLRHPCHVPNSAKTWTRLLEIKLPRNPMRPRSSNHTLPTSHPFTDRPECHFHPYGENPSRQISPGMAFTLRYPIILITLTIMLSRPYPKPVSMRVKHRHWHPHVLRLPFFHPSKNKFKPYFKNRLSPQRQIQSPRYSLWTTL